ncbi:hypothetical protein F444_03222 [Phytophthora nicotianae P1976]|uniref:Uncharacterized protein n=1 Tax=Phytophthora nicotianae P1976 TaxID=1317066 RepID=A0A081AUV6_PHYNI|nr:hypothetical protein F444_03222 [Phytophthora nicotianae P1976]
MMLLADFTLGDDFWVTINNQTVTRSIVELYTGAKTADCAYIDHSRILGVPIFTVVCDILTSKTQKSTKYLGLRLYFIDNNWQFQSILLGTRHYDPMYGERSEGNREPFKRWILELLKDFGLTIKNVYAATTDAGPNVKWMMATGLNLKWEWCMPHRTNAATKMAFGIVPQRCNSKNPDGTDLLSRIARTTYAIRSNASMGSLFAELCEMAKNGASTQLLEHKDHRFMGLEKVIKRLLGKWDQVEDWLQERINKAIRERKAVPEGLPIADDKETLLQLYGLLNPTAAFNTKSQKEDTNQVDVLLTVFQLRITILDETQPIKDKVRSPSEPPLYYQVNNLTRLAKATRALLAKAFHKNFFCRYTDPARIRDTSYIPEMQMLLHPSSKTQDNNLAKIVKLCNEQLIIDPEQPHLRLDEQSVARNVASVKAAVMNRLRALKLDIAKGTALGSRTSTHPRQLPSSDNSFASMLEFPSLQPQAVFSEDLMEFTEEAAVTDVSEMCTKLESKKNLIGG